MLIAPVDLAIRNERDASALESVRIDHASFVRIEPPEQARIAELRQAISERVEEQRERAAGVENHRAQLGYLKKALRWKK